MKRNYTIEDLEEILDKIPHQVWLKDKEGKHIYINKSGADCLGLEKSCIIGKDDYEIRKPEIAKKCVETDKILLESKHDIYNEECGCVDGNKIYHKVHKFMINRGKEKDDIIGGIAEDISLDKKIQLEIEDNLSKYLDESKTKEEYKLFLQSILTKLRKALNVVNIDILLYDDIQKAFNFYLSENETNSKFYDEEYIYISRDEEIELYSEKSTLDNSSKIYERIIKGQKNYTEESIIQKLKIIKLANKPFGVACVYYENYKVQDYENNELLDVILTKISMIIKQIENKEKISIINKKKDELESIVDFECMKTDFLANISHEFRTPVNIILSTVQLIIGYIDGKNKNMSKQNCIEYLKILKQNSYRLLRLVNNSIDTAKINSNYYDLNLSNHNIISIIEDITMSTVKYANDKKRSIIFDTDEEEVILACDPGQIERVILNLISNAIKFSHENTDIEVKIETDFEEKKLYVLVKNYGDIIEEEYIDKIFAKFTQIDNLFIRKNEGSGIGLYLSKKNS